MDFSYYSIAQTWLSRDSQFEVRIELAPTGRTGHKHPPDIVWDA